MILSNNLSDNFLTWYQSLDDQTVTSLNLTISIYLIKIKHKDEFVQISSSKSFHLMGCVKE